MVSVMSAMFGGGAVADVVLGDCDRVDIMTIADCKTVGSRMAKGEITADEVRQLWQWYLRDRAAISAELGQLKKDELMQYAGMSARRSDKKESLVRSALGSLSEVFYHDSFSWSPFQETRECAIDRKLQELTDEHIQQYAAECKAEQKEFQDMLADPQTLEQFRRFIMYRGKDKLDDEQLQRYDRLLAESSREKQQYEQERKLQQAAIAQPVQTTATLSYQQTTHTRDGYDLWVVQLSDRVERDEFTRLRDRAKVLGGWYSRFRGNGAIAGFQFKTEQGAIDFCKVDEAVGRDTTGQVNAGERRRESAIAHLSQVADNLIGDSRSRIQRERLINTRRRLTIANGCVQDAMRDFALAKTIRKFADALESRSEQVVFCDRLHYAVEFQDLESYLRQAHYTRRREEKLPYSESVTVSIEDIKYAEYPYPGLHGSNLTQLLKIAETISGCKKLAASIQRYARSASSKIEEKYIKFKSQAIINDVRTLVSRLKANTRNWQLIESSYDRLSSSLLKYDRMVRLNITDEATFRTALREYLMIRDDVSSIVDPNAGVKRKSQLAPLLKILDFFPTPKSLRDRVYELAQLAPGLTVLEPGAGRGDFADELRDMGHEVSVCEVNPYLTEILEAKNHKIVGSDFLDYIPVEGYDRIIANFPFTKNADIEHCYKAYQCLKFDGRMVAIVGAGSIENGRVDDEDSIEESKLNKFQKFRRWLDEVGAGIEKLPDGSFKNSDRSTGVACYMVTIDKF